MLRFGVGRRPFTRSPRVSTAFTPASLFSGGEVGFWPAPTDLATLFQDSIGTTAVSAVADPIGLALEKSAGLVLGAERVTNGGFDADASWAKAAGWSISGGVATHAAGSAADLSQDVFAAVGRTYQITLTVSGRTAGGLQIYAGFPSTPAPSITTNGTFTKRMLVAGDTTLYLTAGATFDGSVDNVSVKEIPGYHGLQGTSAARPTLRDVSRKLFRFDGGDDNLLSTLKPSAAFTMVVAVEFNAASDVAIGSQASTSTRCYIGTNASGVLGGGVGTENSATIIDSGAADIRGVAGVAALSFDGSTVKLYWNGAKVYEGAQSGTPTTTIPIMLGALNNNGTAASFLDGDVYDALAIQRCLTESEVAQLSTAFAP